MYIVPAWDTSSRGVRGSIINKTLTSERICLYRNERIDIQLSNLHSTVIVLILHVPLISSVAIDVTGFEPATEPQTLIVCRSTSELHANSEELPPSICFRVGYLALASLLSPP